ncbi:MAG TPA: glycosyltransferase family 2 protein [Gemmatimonadales bacterium]|nr:glycosyltransferase family 2 protein [Gemmatimonadales bacterium]
MIEGRIEVLLSTYNGEAFLHQQLESILRQSGVDLTLTIRDDGSTDGTRELLRRQAARDPRVRVFTENNLGSAASFFALLGRADPEAQYFAFADQDDEWLPDKLARALAMLGSRPRTVPLLYSSRVQYVDQDGRPFGVSRPPRRVGFPWALAENPLNGCTMVMNGSLRALLVERPPRVLRHHDWWSYVVAAVLGDVVHDPAVTVRYRQHGGNLIGASTTYVGTLLQRFRKVERGRWTFYPRELAEELLNSFGPRLPVEHTRVLQRLVASQVTLGARLAYAMAPDVRRSRLLDDALFRLLILAGRI